MGTDSRELVLAPAAEFMPAGSWKGLEMAVSPMESLRRIQELQAFVQQVMVRDVKGDGSGDYGIIPGTQKPTLYQPGAQKLAELYGFSHAFVIDERVERWDDPLLFYYLVRCRLVSRSDGRFIGEGIGSCNSREDRYAWRWCNEEDVPKGIDTATLRKKVRETKRGTWVQYRMPNEDLASVVNTILKMACKRAYVHAVLSATRSAGIFTQDAEDLPPEVFGQESSSRSWETDGPEGEPTVKDVAKAKAEEVRRKKAGAPAEDPEVAAYKAKLAEIGEKGSAADLAALVPDLQKRWPEKHAAHKEMAVAYRAAKAGIDARASQGPAAEPGSRPAAEPEQPKDAPAPAGGPPPAPATTEPAEQAKRPPREPGED